MQSSDRTGRRIKLHDLHILATVVQAGSMSKAAAVLSTTQSAISRSIADLEHTIGARLLERTAQGVEPTQSGRALLKRGVVIFDELKQGIQDVQFLTNAGTGELSVGAAAAQSEGIVLAVIDRLSRQYPRVIFHIVAGSTPAVYEALRERRVEIGFVRIGFMGMSGLAPETDVHHELLFDEPMVLVVSADNPWAHRRKIKLADLLNEPWTWPTALDSLIVGAFQASGIDAPRAAVYADAINVRAKLALTGRFIAVLPAAMMKLPAKDPSLKVLPVELSTTHMHCGIASLKNRTLSPLAQLFIECAREIAKPLVKGR